MPQFPQNHVFAIPPDWICEVVSPSSGRLDRIKKMPIYARQGVAHAWIVDPLQQTLEAFANGDGSWRVIATHSENEVVRIAPFEEIEIDLTLLWGAPPS
jgi:Uma2 family endonuclease